MWWLFTTPNTERALVSVFGRQVTRADLPAAPLMVTGIGLVVLACIGWRARDARLATVYLVLFGVAGTGAAWWLSVDRSREGVTLLKLGHSHGVTESDLLALPFVAVAVACAVGGLYALRRSARSRQRAG